MDEFDPEQMPMPATMPPPADPDEAWRVDMMKKLDDVHKNVAALTTLVTQLNDIAQKCFDQMLKDNAEIAQLKQEHDLLEARITLLEGSRNPDA
jgi:uncharacterized coiled-coil DUF342 family protein